MRLLSLAFLLACFSPVYAGVDMVGDSYTHHHHSKKVHVRTETETVTTDRTYPGSITTTHETTYSSSAVKVYVRDEGVILGPERAYVESRPIAPLATGTKHLLVPTAEQWAERAKEGYPPTVRMPYSTTYLVYRQTDDTVY